MVVAASIAGRRSTIQRQGLVLAEEGQDGEEGTGTRHLKRIGGAERAALDAMRVCPDAGRCPSFSLL